MSASARVVIREVPFAKYAQDIAALDKACFENPPALSGAGFWWVALLGGRFVGYAGMRPSEQWERTGYLCRAGLADEARGRRLQRRLIAARIAKARRLGWRWLVTDTYENPPSANNLIATGFRSYLPAKPWAARGAAYWRLNLARKGA